VTSVGTLCLAGEPASDPVYANFFAETMNPNLYLRYLDAMESAERVTQPNRTGQYAMKLTARFSPTLRTAALFWDLSPISFNRVRFHVWNPNPKNLPIYLRVRLVDNEKRGYFLASYKDGGKRPSTTKMSLSALGSPLPTSSSSRPNSGWARYEARLPDDLGLITPKGEAMPNRTQLRERAFMHLAMSFEVDRDFAAFGKSVTLIVDGLELYSDPD
jgi:hypothetical protein